MKLLKRAVPNETTQRLSEREDDTSRSALGLGKDTQFPTARNKPDTVSTATYRACRTQGTLVKTVDETTKQVSKSSGHSGHYTAELEISGKKITYPLI